MSVIIEKEIDVSNVAVQPHQVKFSELGLAQPIVQAIEEIGYQYPTPIQKETIPHLLNGEDILGLAQTGSGKTASFMLPLLSKIEPNKKVCQLLVLAPTRELANQVAKATQDFAKYLNGVNVLAIYGGQPYGGQIKALSQGVQIVIATPGRLIDHLEKGSLTLDHVKAVVLDEADEMLSMGFISDLEDILGKLPESCQTALFSATMPRLIEKLTNKYLKEPVHVRIKQEKGSEPKIDQFYWLLNGYRKTEALIRFLEVETYEAAIIFCRTKAGCAEVAEYLDTRGLNSAALHGDLSQEQREHTLNSLRNGNIKILIATDVAARGIDIQSIDLIINFDPPGDTESYVHRIGRTGRAGRSGRAIIFIAASERQMLNRIEKQVKKPLVEIQVPNNATLEELRRKKFRIALEKSLNNHKLEMYEALVDELIPTDFEPHQVLAALVKIATEKNSLVLPSDPQPRNRITYDREMYDRGGRRGGDRFESRGSFGSRDRDNGNTQSYYIAVGRMDGVEPKNIVGAIANSGGLSSSDIGSIKIYEKHSVVQLPKDLDQSVIENISREKFKDRNLGLRVYTDNGGESNDRGGFRRNSYSRGRNDRNDRGGDRNDRGSRGGEYRSRDRNDRGGYSRDRDGYNKFNNFRDNQGNRDGDRRNSRNSEGRSESNYRYDFQGRNNY